MAEYLKQEMIRFTQSTIGGDPVKLSGQRYEEFASDNNDPAFLRLILHPQARGCLTMGRHVDGNFVVLGERPPTQ